MKIIRIGEKYLNLDLVKIFKVHSSGNVTVFYNLGPQVESSNIRKDDATVLLTFLEASSKKTVEKSSSEIPE